MTQTERSIEFDTSDVDRHVGKPVGGGQLKEPVTATDIRRWVQAMAYPNPIHYDEEAAARSAFGRIVAPQSFTICCDVGHGAGPAIVGNIPGTHMIFGGDEWWFAGPRIYPGDLLRMRRRFVDYKVSDTKFAGPTMFSRGETVYENQRGDRVAKQWSTAVRYRADVARDRGFFEQAAPRPTFTEERLSEIEAQRRTWIRSRAGANSPKVEELEVGGRLPTRPIGPHSLPSMATEWRGYVFTVWGSSFHEGPDHLTEAGWLKEMDRDLEGAKEDPELGDGLYHGPSRGHTDEEHARIIGMPRGYGYGASMGAWVLDYVSAWAGDRGFVRHSAVQYRFPAFDGDVTLLDAEVTSTRHDKTLGTGVVTLEVTMTNQDGSVMAKGPVEVELPRLTRRTGVSTFVGPPSETEPGLGPLTMGGLLDEVASVHSGREALCFGDGSSTTVRWSYAQLAEHSRDLARALVSAGVGKGTRIAVLMGNRPEWVQCAFGVALAGGVLVPVNTLFEPPEIEHVLRHSDCAIVLHQKHLGHHDYEEQLRSIEDRLPYLSHRFCLETPQYEEFLVSGRAFTDDVLAARASEVSPFDDSLIVYTSGSTGRPKGVLHAHRAAAIQSWRFAQQMRLDPTVRVWSAFPFFWTAGFCMVMGATLAAGGCLVLEELFDAGEALALMVRERVTSPHAWPHQMAALEAHPDWELADLSSVRHVVSFTPLARHPSVKLEGSWSPRSAYGLTETFTIISSMPADTPEAMLEGHEGKILPGNSVRIVDADSGTPQPAGATGEIRVKGPTLMKGYVKVAPEEVFDEDGFFATGDSGFVDAEGRLHWSGRTSDLIKTGGANVSPVEIETELLHHPELQSALAVGVSHPTLDQMVVVCAVAKQGSTLTEEGVRDFLRGRLASYKLPRRVLFFEEDELVLTGNSKIRVAELRALAEARLGSASGVVD